MVLVFQHCINVGSGSSRNLLRWCDIKIERQQISCLTWAIAGRVLIPVVAVVGAFQFRQCRIVQLCVSIMASVCCNLHEALQAQKVAPTSDLWPGCLWIQSQPISI
eukprot:SAG31_NODE_300_length_18109_cov_47.887285_8_plen_106_part_00